MNTTISFSPVAALVSILLGAHALDAQAGGTVNFGNNNSNRIVNAHSAAAVTAAESVRVALYWSPLDTNNFVQLGATAPVGVPAPGIFIGGTRTTGVATAGGAGAQFQVRAWGGDYATYEEAQQQPGVLIGQSAVFVNPTGDSGGAPPAPPESLLAGGFAGFAISSNAVNVQPPILSGPGDKTVACDSSWAFDEPTATDGCTGSNLTAVVFATVTNGVCPVTITRTWSATNSCNLSFAMSSQTVTVEDVLPPVLECAGNLMVPCGTPWAFGEPAAVDACSTALISELSTVTNRACGGTYSATRVWLATDACGNSTQCTQTVSVVDVVAPQITCLSNKLAPCGGNWTFDVPGVSNECSGTNLHPLILATVTNEICPLVVTRTWVVSDTCGNSNACSQTITVSPAAPPSLVCATNKIVACTNEWDFDAPSALDACGGNNVTVEIVATVTNSLCPLSLTRSWRATNDCTPEGVTCSQTVTVLCPSCPVLQLTKACPAYPVPPGGTLAWIGTITNGGDITVSNVVVVNDQPATDTLVFGPVTLAPGEGASFAGSYSVPASGGSYVDTLSATGVGPDGVVISGSATASCPSASHVTPGDMNGDGIVSQSELNDVLANYWAHSEWVTMTNAAVLCDGRFQFSLTNAGAWGFTVLVSTNLVDWTNLPAPAIPVFQFVDPEGTNAPQRLYRLQWP